MSELPPRRRTRKRTSDANSDERQRNQKRERSAREPHSDNLGKLLEVHEVTLVGLLVVCGILGVIGCGVFGWGYFKNPITRTSLTVMIVGGFIVLMGLILFGINVLNLGRRLELRKRGIRFSERGRSLEMLWSEIAHVAVDRLDATNFGVGTKYSRSNDAAAVSGPLTKSEFTVTIHSESGESIVLASNFLRTVADPKQMISNLKLRSGV